MNKISLNTAYPFFCVTFENATKEELTGLALILQDWFDFPISTYFYAPLPVKDYMSKSEMLNDFAKINNFEENILNPVKKKREVNMVFSNNSPISLFAGIDVEQRDMFKSLNLLIDTFTYQLPDLFVIKIPNKQEHWQRSRLNKLKASYPNALCIVSDNLLDNVEELKKRFVMAYSHVDLDPTILVRNIDYFKLK